MHVRKSLGRDAEPLRLREDLHGSLAACKQTDIGGFTDLEQRFQRGFVVVTLRRDDRDEPLAIRRSDSSQKVGKREPSTRWRSPRG